LTRKDTKFTWSPQEKIAFEELKKAFTEAPIIIHFNPGKLITIETDASDHSIRAVLSQPGIDKKLHPVAFMSRKLLPAQCNYTIYQKELLTIV
jgi:hypothetical protein